MVVPRRRMLLAASASMAMTRSGFISRMRPDNIRAVSIPVCAMTPGAIAFNPVSFCETLRLFTVRGPRESGVTLWFPRPATNMTGWPCKKVASFSSPSFFPSACSASSFNTFASSSETSLWKSSSGRSSLSASNVR